MESHENILTGPSAAREKRWVAMTSLLAAIVMTATKLAAGLLTNSLGILSEAGHSALDLAAAAMTFWVVRAAALPADSRHPYGHGKFENMSALFETGLLLLTCILILIEAVKRLFFEAREEVDANVWAFGVVVLSIVLNYSRTRALNRAAQKYQSQALAADALHFRTDIWSSWVVLVGLGLVVLADYLHLDWLTKADAVAALGVALIAVWVSVKLGRKSIEDLVDAVPLEVQQQVESAVHVEGVQQVRMVRVRRSGPEYFADVTVAVSPEAHLERAHEIADRVESAVKTVLTEADVVVHVEPSSPADESLLTTIRLTAARAGLGVHSVRLYEEGGKQSVEMHLEVADTLSVRDAHGQVEQFESAIRQAAPQLARIVTHIEPVGQASVARQSELAAAADVRAALAHYLKQYHAHCLPHDVEVRRQGNELVVNFHCQMDGSTAITDAHDFTEKVEKYLRSQVPDVGRVVIHVEPPEGS